MKNELNAQVFIELGNGYDLALSDTNQIFITKKRPDGVVVGMPLCDATDEGVESVKGYIDRLRSMA
jgi:hypothetical protein